MDFPRGTFRTRTTHDGQMVIGVLASGMADRLRLAWMATRLAAWVLKKGCVSIIHQPGPSK